MGWIDRALLAVAAALLFVCLLPLGARWSWLLDLTTHFRAQYVAAGVVLLVLLAARRKLKWCIALAACLALSAAPLVDYWPASASGEETAVEVRVATVNLSHLDYSGRALLDIVRAESPDVLLLIEFTRIWDERLRELDSLYAHRVKIPARGPFGLALLSRYELTELQQIDLAGNAAIHARVAGPTRAFTMIGVHLRAPTDRRRFEQRNRQLEILAELRTAIGEPLVVLGDFNITPYSPFFADWLEKTGLRDARADTGFGFSWPTFLPLVGIPIDHCIVSSDFRAIDVRRLPAFGSDHYPVLVRLGLR